MFSSDRLNLMMELTALFKAFIEKGVFDEETILQCWKLANLSDDEMKKQADKAVVDIVSNIVPELLVRASAGDEGAMRMLDMIMPELEKYMKKKEKGNA